MAENQQAELPREKRGNYRISSALSHEVGLILAIVFVLVGLLVLPYKVMRNRMKQKKAEEAEEIEEKLHQLKTDPDANHQEIQLAEEDLKTLDYLYENYYHGMNVFRTAKGGRATLRE